MAVDFDVVFGTGGSLIGCNDQWSERSAPKVKSPKENASSRMRFERTDFMLDEVIVASRGVTRLLFLGTWKRRLGGRRVEIYDGDMRATLSFLVTIVFSGWAVIAAEPDKEKDLFNGKDLSGWVKTEFGGEGEVQVKD